MGMNVAVVFVETELFDIAISECEVSLVSAAYAAEASDSPVTYGTM